MAGVERQVARTLGELVDRLSILNLKLWFVQEAVHQAASKGEGLDAETVARLASLNLARNAAMTDIDVCLDTAVKAGFADVDARIKLVE